MYHTLDKRQPNCVNCGKPMSQWRASDECSGRKETLKPDYSRAAFVEAIAPQTQACSCLCGEQISRNQACFAKPYVVRGKQTGTTRLVNMDHYDAWLENVAHKYVQTIINRRPETKEYFDGNTNS